MRVSFISVCQALQQGQPIPFFDLCFHSSERKLRYWFFWTPHLHIVSIFFAIPHSENIHLYFCFRVELSISYWPCKILSFWHVFCPQKFLSAKFENIYLICHQSNWFYKFSQSKSKLKIIKSFKKKREKTNSILFQVITTWYFKFYVLFPSLEIKINSNQNWNPFLYKTRIKLNNLRTTWWEIKLDLFPVAWSTTAVHSTHKLKLWLKCLK